MPFEKGKKRHPLAGRRKGVPNKPTGLIREALILAAQQVGEPDIEHLNVGTEEKPHYIQVRTATGKDELVGYMRFLALHRPDAYAMLMAKVLPMQIVKDERLHATVEFVEAREKVQQRLESVKTKLLDARVVSSREAGEESERVEIISPGFKRERM